MAATTLTSTSTSTPNTAFPSTSAPSTPARSTAALCMRLLGAGIPLSLVCDLTDDAGPSSRDILEHEGSPDLAWWSAG